jgi:hypothetical protein
MTNHLQVGPRIRNAFSVSIFVRPTWQLSEPFSLGHLFWAVILLSGSQLLKSCAKPTGLPAKSDSLARRFADCGELQCAVFLFIQRPIATRWARISIWQMPLCGILLSSKIQLVCPSHFTRPRMPSLFQVRSLEYIPPAEGGDKCPYIQFSFFNAQNQSTGWTYIRPGQTDVPCVTFSNATVTGYNGVTMLTDVPENLLYWADNDGNVAYEGFIEDDTSK